MFVAPSLLTELKTFFQTQYNNITEYLGIYHKINKLIVHWNNIALIVGRIEQFRSKVSVTFSWY